MTADPSSEQSELTDLRDALEDAISRAYRQTLAEPERVITDPGEMRRLATIQHHAWNAVRERVEVAYWPWWQRALRWVLTVGGRA